MRSEAAGREDQKSPERLTLELKGIRQRNQEPELPEDEQILAEVGVLRRRAGSARLRQLQTCP